MLMPEVPSSPLTEARLKTLRILHSALCLGAVFAGVVLVGIRLGNPNVPAPAGAPIISYIGVAFALMSCVVAAVFPAIMTANWRRSRAPAPVVEAAGDAAGPS